LIPNPKVQHDHVPNHKLRCSDISNNHRRNLATGYDDSRPLATWVHRHAKRIQAAYRGHVTLGGSPDVVMMATPHDGGSLADANPVIVASTRDEASEMVKSARGGRMARELLTRPAPADLFFVIAYHHTEGYTNLFLGVISIPHPEDQLPEIAPMTRINSELN
jgi:hypothetical protein